MLSNPFTSNEGAFQMGLCEDLYQRIHALAVRRAVQGYAPFTVPRRFQIDLLRQQVAKKGPDVCLLHPAELTTLFQGVTLAVYCTIEALYCSRVGRRISTIWQILEAMATAVQVQPVNYEAVWAACVYLEEQRLASIQSNVERGHECWWIGKMMSEFVIQEPGGRRTVCPALLGVADLSRKQVLAVRILPEADLEQESSLLLYDAICAQRRPRPQTLTGVLWHLPQQVISETPLSPDGRSACEHLGIAVEGGAGPLPFVQTLQTTVTSLLSGRVLYAPQYLLLLDRCLTRTFGYGPLSIQRHYAQKYAHLAGYPQEPTWLFPHLRAFLPTLPATITDEGCIEHNGLHYTDNLLQYFPGRAVMIRRFAHMEAGIWVYLDGGVLCQAWARELRRRDGTYRPSRPGGN